MRFDFLRQLPHFRSLGPEGSHYIIAAASSSTLSRLPEQLAQDFCRSVKHFRLQHSHRTAKTYGPQSASHTSVIKGSAWRAASPVRWARRWRRLRVECVAVSHCIIWHAAGQSGGAGAGEHVIWRRAPRPVLSTLFLPLVARTISARNCTCKCGEAVQ